MRNLLLSIIMLQIINYKINALPPCVLLYASDIVCLSEQIICPVWTKKKKYGST